MFPLSFTGTIGRGDQVTVDLDQPEISRSHARITFNDHGGWTLEDLNSANGTWLDGVPVKGKVPLGFGSRLQLGGSVMMVFTHRDVLEDQVFQMQKLEVLGRLAGEVAHDLRNLLTVYRFNIDCLREAIEDGVLMPAPGADMGEIETSFHELDNVTSRATDLTGRLLGFARSEGAERQDLDVGELILEVASMARAAMPETIEVKPIVRQRPLLVSASSSRLHQALMNLCVNARDAMLDGGELKITASRLRSQPAGIIEAPVSGNGEFVVVSISDTGVGMDEDTQGKIFEPFYTTKERGEGTGLGLATVYAVVKDHGGQIKVNSAPGRGTIFTLAFPMASAPGTDFKATRAESRHTTSVGEANSVLVISPRQEGRKQVSDALRDLGLNVFWEDEQPGALARLQSELECLAVVLFDLELPTQNSSQLARTIRRIAPQIPLVLWTSNTRPVPELEQQAADVGAHGVLLSPVNKDALFQVISYAVSRMVTDG